MNEPTKLRILVAADQPDGPSPSAVLEQFSRMGVAAHVVVMTAWGSVDLAVEAMRRGVRDFVPKP